MALRLHRCNKAFVSAEKHRASKGFPRLKRIYENTAPAVFHYRNTALKYNRKAVSVVIVVVDYFSLCIGLPLEAPVDHNKFTDKPGGIFK